MKKSFNKIQDLRWVKIPTGVLLEDQEHALFLACRSLSEENWREILLSKPKQRFLMLHGGNIEKCWDEFTRQQQLLSRFSMQTQDRMANLHIPHVLWGDKRDQTRRQTHALSRLHNALGWLQYCAWYDQENRALIDSILLDDAEKYQLLAACELYDTEVHSEMLEHVREDIENLLKFEDELFSAGDPNDQRTLFTLEKQMIRLQMEAEAILKGHEDVLEQLSEALEKLLPDHPELGHFTLHLRLLRILLADLAGKGDHQLHWLQQIQFLQLLNREFGVETICSATPDDSGVYLFAAVVSISLLHDHYPLEILVELILDWSHYAERLMTLEQNQGGIKTEQWLEGLVKQEGEHLLAYKLLAAFQLRHLFGKIVERFKNENENDVLLPEVIAKEMAFWLP